MDWEKVLSWLWKYAPALVGYLTLLARGRATEFLLELRYVTNFSVTWLMRVLSLLLVIGIAASAWRYLKDSRTWPDRLSVGIPYLFAVIAVVSSSMIAWPEIVQFEKLHRGEDNVVVVVANFSQRQSGNSLLSDDVARKLRDDVFNKIENKLKENLQFEIVPISIPTEHRDSVLQNLRRDKDADIVVWGEYVAADSQVYVSLYTDIRNERARSLVYRCLRPPLEIREVIEKSDPLGWQNRLALRVAYRVAREVGLAYFFQERFTETTLYNMRQAFRAAEELAEEGRRELMPGWTQETIGLEYVKDVFPAIRSPVDEAIVALQQLGEKLQARNHEIPAALYYYQALFYSEKQTPEDQRKAIALFQEAARKIAEETKTSKTTSDASTCAIPVTEAEVFFNMGNSYYRLSQLRAALAAYQQAESAYKALEKGQLPAALELAQIYLGLGRVYYTLGVVSGDETEAEVLLGEAESTHEAAKSSLSQESPASLSARVHIGLGNIHLHRGRRGRVAELDRAIKEFAEALKFAGENAEAIEAYHFLSQTYRVKADHASANAAENTADKLRRQHPEAMIIEYAVIIPSGGPPSIYSLGKPIGVTVIPYNREGMPIVGAPLQLVLKEGIAGGGEVATLPLSDPNKNGFYVGNYSNQQFEGRWGVHEGRIEKGYILGVRVVEGNQPLHSLVPISVTIVPDIDFLQPNHDSDGYVLNRPLPIKIQLLVNRPTGPEPLAVPAILDALSVVAEITSPDGSKWSLGLQRSEQGMFFSFFQEDEYIPTIETKGDDVYTLSVAAADKATNQTIIHRELNFRVYPAAK